MGTNVNVKVGNGKPPFTTKPEFITPDCARDLLSRECKHNRREYPQHVKDIAADMLAGRYIPTHQPIAISWDGELIDGKHRCRAIVESGIGQWMNVSRGVPPDVIETCDQNRIRTPADSLRVRGITACPADIACATGMKTAGFNGNVRLTRSEQAASYEEHREAVDFAMQHLGGGTVPGITIAAVRSVVARAWYSGRRTRLAYFCQILKSGEHTGQDEDNAAIKLRNRLVNAATGGWAIRRRTHRQTEYCLMAFLNRRPIVRVLEAQEELFPIPGDEEPCTAKPA